MRQHLDSKSFVHLPLVGWYWMQIFLSILHSYLLALTMDGAVLRELLKLFQIGPCRCTAVHVATVGLVMVVCCPLPIVGSISWYLHFAPLL